MDHFPQEDQEIKNKQFGVTLVNSAQRQEVNSLARWASSGFVSGDSGAGRSGR
jgi:hypothetical protein